MLKRNTDVELHIDIDMDTNVEQDTNMGIGLGLNHLKEPFLHYRSAMVSYGSSQLYNDIDLDVCMYTQTYKYAFLFLNDTTITELSVSLN